MVGAVICDDRRAIVVGSEIETGAGVLPDVDLISEAPEFLPRQFALRSGVLDVAGNRAAAADFSLGMRHRKPRDLAGDRPAFRLVGIENRGRRPPVEMGRE